MRLAAVAHSAELQRDSFAMSSVATRSHNRYTRRLIQETVDDHRL
jgi:hypothetical protein